MANPLAQLRPELHAAYGLCLAHHEHVDARSPQHSAHIVPLNPRSAMHTHRCSTPSASHAKHFMVNNIDSHVKPLVYCHSMAN
jgi:hypothetical protein